MTAPTDFPEDSDFPKNSDALYDEAIANERRIEKLEAIAKVAKELCRVSVFYTDEQTYKETYMKLAEAVTALEEK